MSAHGKLKAALDARAREEHGALVIAPATELELIEALRLLAEHGASFGPAIRLSREAFTAIGEVDGKSAVISAEAGVRLADLERRANAHDLSLGPLPPGAEALTVAEFLEGPHAGLRVCLGGRLEPIALAVRALLHDGVELVTHRSPRSAAGPDLKALVLGAGGRLALVLEAELRLVPRASHHSALAFRFDSERALTRAAIAIVESGVSCSDGRAEVVGGGFHLELSLAAPSEAVLVRDRASALKAAQRAGATVLPEPAPRQDLEGAGRELSWAGFEEALGRGEPLALHRIAMESVVVQGAREGGLPLDRPAGWSGEALKAAIDPAQVFGGRDE